MAPAPTQAKTPVVDPQYPVDYASREVPPTYKCGTCNATNCKLWRDYQTSLQHQELYCATCAGKAQKKEVSDMDAEGRRTSRGHKTDTIGWLVPAVPSEENDNFWGYTSVPENGVQWWRGLPSFPS